MFEILLTDLYFKPLEIKTKMTDAEAENRLKLCLEACINAVQEIVGRLKHQGQSQEDASLINTALDVNIHSFTLDASEEALMSELKTNLKTVLREHLPYLSRHCRRYLLDFLQEVDYNSKKHEFTSPFNIGVIDSFIRDLQSKLASISAFRAAWDGNQIAVEEFIRQYPTVKDRSGLWATTLLYSAARNNHLKLVEYLIRRAKCAVNAQSQQHTIRAVPGATSSHDDYDTNPVAGSTALHGACYYGHLAVVKFLIEHGADYFIRNHSDETPIDNANSRPEILQYFRDFLILGYSSKSTDLSNAPALLEGYSDNAFVSMRELQYRNLHFIRYNGQGDTIAALDLQSTLTRPINTAPVSLVLARDIRHSTAIRANAILSFVGEIKSDWLEHKIERQVDL